MLGRRLRSLCPQVRGLVVVSFFVRFVSFDVCVVTVAEIIGSPLPPSLPFNSVLINKSLAVPKSRPRRSQTEKM